MNEISSKGKIGILERFGGIFVKKECLEGICIKRQG
jgi:hypothetical protein